jgi:hypothetical protein
LICPRRRFLGLKPGADGAHDWRATITPRDKLKRRDLSLKVGAAMG